MPIDPTFGILHADATALIIQDAETAMLRILANHVKAGVLTSKDRYRIRALARTVTLRRELGMATLDLKARLGADVWAHVQALYQEAEQAALTDLAAHGIDWVLPPVRAAMMARLADELVRAVAGVAPAMITRLQGAYFDAVYASLSGMVMGGITRVEAAQQVLDMLADRGITGFTDAAGRRWQASTYAEMSLRTGYAAIARAAHLETLAANGHDLVIVSTAPHPCPLCTEWEGKVLALSGRAGTRLVDSAVDANARVPVEVAGTVDQAVKAGLHHPNCRHALSAYFPGIEYDDHPSVDPAEYRAMQDQRYLERGIRRWRRREAVALTPEAAEAAACRIELWSQRLDAHMAAHPYLTRKPRREEIGAAH